MNGNWNSPIGGIPSGTVDVLLAAQGKIATTYE